MGSSRIIGTRRLACVLGAATTMAGALPAAAQIVSSPDDVALPRTGLFARDQNVSVQDRPRPDYAPLNIQAGSFTIAPELDTSLEYNSNIYATNTNDVSDEIFHITPEFTANSNWSRNALSFFGRGAFNEYVNHGTEDANNGAIGTTGRYDIADDAGVAAGASYEHDSISRTSPNSPYTTLHPLQYNEGSAFLVGAVEFVRVRFSARYDFQEFRYDNDAFTGGGTFYAKNLDYNVNIGTFRAEYAVSPGASIFANLVVNNQENVDLRPIDVSRSSSGYEATIGSNFNLTHLIRGEVFLGYLDQTFSSSLYKEVSGATMRGYLQWFPTQLVTVTFSGTRIPIDSNLPGVGAYLDSNATARADYELLRNLLITASVTYENDDFYGVSRTDDRNYETLTATYLMNRRISLNLSYQHQEDSSHGSLAGQSFNINSITAGVALRY